MDFLAPSSDLVKKARLHENAVPADQINGRTPVETSKKAFQNVEKTRHENEDEIIMDFGTILAHFGCILGCKS